MEGEQALKTRVAAVKDLSLIGPAFAQRPLFVAMSRLMQSQQTWIWLFPGPSLSLPANLELS